MPIISFQLLNSDTGLCECSCKLPDEGCELNFRYTNGNAIQDDVWQLNLYKPDGTVVSPSSVIVDGTCEAYLDPDDPCSCLDVDVKNYYYTVDNSLISPCLPCSIRFDWTEVTSNGCGTCATIQVFGPYGEGTGGTGCGCGGGDPTTGICLGDSGYLDISMACEPAP